MKIEMMLEQGTEDWLAMRRQYRMASETPAVMRLSPYAGPQSVRDSKAGKRAYVNPAMRQGTEQEPIARAWFEDVMSEMMRPAVFVNGKYGASLDGISLDGKSIIEIKTPYTETGDRWEAIYRGELTLYDMAQVQHQLMVSEAELCYFIVWSPTTQTGVTQVVHPDPDWWARIDEAWESFEKKPRDDENWTLAAAEYLEAKKVFAEAEKRLEAAKQALIDIRASDQDNGAGVRILKVERKGNIDWKVVQKQHLIGVDVERYRGKTTSFFKVESDE